MKRELLWISLCAPYDNVRHAGGKIHNYYLKKLINNKDYSVKLITFCEMDEFNSVVEDHKKYDIDSTVIPWSHEFNLRNLKRKLQFINYYINPLQKYAGETNEYYWENIKQALNEKKPNPNIIILQWTQIVLFGTKIKKIFPNARLVAIEEDVMYLSLFRKYAGESSPIRKLAKQIRYTRAKNIEINALKIFDKVILNNPKDEKLINDEGVINTMVWVPFFNDYSSVNRILINEKQILFYGAMSRYENYSSAIWFIQKVLPLIKDLHVRFVIVGNNPNNELLKYESVNVQITGFVEDVIPFFSESLCLVAPLVLGAGVKIKILESLSAGIPVLTNKIGIEGIPAPKDAFIFCEEPEEYANAIRELISHRVDGKAVGNKGRMFIGSNYNFEKSFEQFISMINEEHNQCR